MNVKFNIKSITAMLLLSLTIAFFNNTYADETLVSPTVDQNIQAMDKDKDGMVSTEEMKIYLQALHGKDYKHDVLDTMEATMSSRSCGSPFSNSFY